MFDGEFGVGCKYIHNVATVFCQLVDQVCYLHTLVIVFVAGKTFSGILVAKCIAPFF